jgi:hypothetical protein
LFHRLREKEDFLEKLVFAQSKREKEREQQPNLFLLSSARNLIVSSKAKRKRGVKREVISHRAKEKRREQQPILSSLSSA